MASRAIFTAGVRFPVNMDGLPVMWYVLLALVSFFGVSTWWLHNFSDREELKRVSAFSGVISMAALLYLTFTTEGI